MTYYFILAARRLNRGMRDAGMNPVVGYFLVVTGFIAGSFFIFSKMTQPAVIYLMIALMFVSTLSEKQRNNFLKSVFNGSDYLVVRMIENILIAIPFAVFLFFRTYFIYAGLLILASALMSFFKFTYAFNVVLPTPFSKKPYEFAAGFRNTWLLIILGLLLTLAGIIVSNYNLSVSGLLLLIILSAFYYSVPEDPFFVWSFSLSPTAFLRKKIFHGLLHLSIMILPSAIAIGIIFRYNLISLVVFILSGYLLLATMIISRYVSYPVRMSIPQGIILASCIYFPPLLLVVLPYFYIQSVKHLGRYLK